MIKHPLFKDGVTWVIQKSQTPGAYCYAIWVERELNKKEANIIEGLLSNRIEPTPGDTNAN